MTQENIELLRKDIYARIPYGVKGIDSMGNISSPKDWETEFTIEIIVNCTTAKYEWRPYLFPIASMTEEQYEEFIRISSWNGSIEDIKQGKFYCVGCIGFDWLYDTIDWLNKNHFDYRGLIEKGLAVDTTGLDIY